MTPEYFTIVLFGWSIVATIAYRCGHKCGFEEGRVLGRIDVVNYIKRATERKGTVLISDDDRIGMRDADQKIEVLEDVVNV